LQLRVGAALLIDDEQNTLNMGLMPGRADLDSPRTRRELRERERTRVAGRRRACVVGRLVHRCHACADDNGSRWILHTPADRAAMALRVYSDGQQ
jgi:hypothetical protein